MPGCGGMGSPKFPRWGQGDECNHRTRTSSPPNCREGCTKLANSEHRGCDAVGFRAPEGDEQTETALLSPRIIVGAQTFLNYSGAGTFVPLS